MHCTAGVLTVACQKSRFIPAGYLALGLSYAIGLTSLLKMTVRVVARVEAQFNSVERVRHYIHNEKAQDGCRRVDPQLQLEDGGAALVTDGAAAGDIELGSGKSRHPVEVIPEASWPQHGAVEFRGVYMQYRDLPCVLKGVSFAVAGREKIGVAGRTGSVFCMHSLTANLSRRPLYPP